MSFDHSDFVKIGFWLS